MHMFQWTEEQQKAGSLLPENGFVEKQIIRANKMIALPALTVYYSISENVGNCEGQLKFGGLYLTL